jgi:N,N'-diacetyllegionaminate synthase
VMPIMGTGVPLGIEHECFVIAEAGVNHNGKLKLAIRLVDAAQRAGADAVKFQTFVAEELVTAQGRKAAYQTRSRERTQLSMLKKLELGKSDFEAIKAHADSRGIEFMSTPYDPQSVALLEGLGVRRFKVSSTDLTNKPLVETVARTGRQVILSTGMATLSEIKRTVSRIVELGNEDIVLMHCTSSYPTPVDQVNMRAMETLRREFPFPVGYSDHTLGIEVGVMAVALGARVLEKHLTLDRRMEGPDHFASAGPAEFKRLVSAVRNVQSARGTGEKALMDDERENLPLVRRSLHAAKNLRKGRVLSAQDVRISRPNDGADPWDVDRVVGMRTRRGIKRDDPVRLEDLEPATG